MTSILPSVLGRIASLHLEEIEFTYGLPEYFDLMTALENDARFTRADSMWTALDDVLSTFSILRVVRFNISVYQAESPSLVDHVKRGLSSCNKRGLLSFGRADNPLNGTSPRDSEISSVQLI
jgi:hypothetical protein